jgi:SOS response regulatory protein OraA/RecX
MIESELREKGVPREVIEEYRAQHDDPERAPEDQGLPGDERSRARVALAAHLRGRPVPDEAKARQRLGMYLMRRGFDPETVRAVIREAAEPSAADDRDGPDP